MGFVSGLKSIIYKADFFYTAELLRYKEEPEYRTLLGGVLSLSIIIALLATFSNRVIDTLNKVVITTTSSNTNEADPPPFNLSSMSGSKFMFGVQIWHHDLTDNVRFFDVILTNAEFYTGQRQDASKTYLLEPCTLSHWQDFPDIQSQYTKLKMNQWLCMPKDSQFNIQGKYSSNTSYTLQVSVRKCNNDSNLTGRCATPQQIDDYFLTNGNAFFTIYFTNPLINPGDSSYLTYYLQDNNYIIFTQQFGAEGILFMEEFGITTDESILPFTDIRTEKGGVVNQFALKNPYQVTMNNSVYCSFSFFKSGVIKSYDRTYQKIDEVLSYIGGLFGTIAICLVLVNIYNGYSFEITIGSYLFRSNDSQENKFKKYNFFSFMAHLVFALLDTLGCHPNWTNASLYFACREEMVKQLDILYLLKRVSFLERAMSTLLDDHQIRAVYLQNKQTLDEAKQLRLCHKSKQKAIIECRKILRKNTLTEEDPRYNTENMINKTHLQKETQKGNRSVQEININFDSFNHGQKAQKTVLLHQKTDGNQGIFASESSQNQEQESLPLGKSLLKLRDQANEGKQLSRRLWEGLDHQIKLQLLQNNENDQFIDVSNSIEMKQISIRPEILTNREQTQKQKSGRVQNLSNKVKSGRDGHNGQIQNNSSHKVHKSSEISSGNLKQPHQAAPFFNEASKVSEGEKWSWEKPQQADMDIQQLEFNYVFK